MDIKIRNAELSDHGFLTEVFRLSNEEHLKMRDDLYRVVENPVLRWKYNTGIVLRKTIKYKPVSLQIAEHDGKRVGAVYVESEGRGDLSWSAFPKTALVDNIVVLPEYRRKGIASALLSAADDWRKATGHEYISAKILNQNEASLALFENNGFKVDFQVLGKH